MPCQVAIVVLVAVALLAVLASTHARVRIPDRVEAFQGGAAPNARRPPANVALTPAAS